MRQLSSAETISKGRTAEGFLSIALLAVMGTTLMEETGLCTTLSTTTSSIGSLDVHLGLPWL